MPRTSEQFERKQPDDVYSIYIDTDTVSKVPSGICVRPPLACLTMASTLESSTRQDISSRGSFKVRGSEF